MNGSLQKIDLRLGRSERYAYGSSLSRNSYGVKTNTTGEIENQIGGECVCFRGTEKGTEDAEIKTMSRRQSMYIRPIFQN